MTTVPPDAHRFRNRIVGHSDEPPEDLLAHPLNFQIHTQLQQEAMTEALDRLGWIDEVKVNRNTQRMVNGHLRVILAMRYHEPTVPVTWLDLTEAEEEEALATYDPIAKLAKVDGEQLRELHARIAGRVQTPALSQTLTELRARTDALLAGQEQATLKQEARAAPAAVEKDTRLHQVDLIYTAGALNQDATELRNRSVVHCCIAVKSGWLYGVQSTGAGGICANFDRVGAHRVAFIDNHYKEYDHTRHAAAVEMHRPQYTTVRDIMTPEQCAEAGIAYYPFEQIMDWAEELAAHAEQVIVIPKYDCLDKIPDKFMLGFSVPTSYGGTPLPAERFRGRRVHLLGGSPNKQIAYFKQLPTEVVSLDNNYILKIANYGNVWLPDGTTRTLGDFGLGRVTNPLYSALVLSLGNFAAFFHKQGAPDAQLGIIAEAADLAA